MNKLDRMKTKEEILNIWVSIDDQLKTFLGNIDVNNISQSEREELIKLSSQSQILIQIMN